MPAFCPSRELGDESMQLESGKFSAHPSSRYVPTVTKEMTFLKELKCFHFSIHSVKYRLRLFRKLSTRCVISFSATTVIVLHLR